MIILLWTCNDCRSGCPIKLCATFDFNLSNFNVSGTSSSSLLRTFCRARHPGLTAFSNFSSIFFKLKNRGIFWRWILKITYWRLSLSKIWAICRNDRGWIGGSQTFLMLKLSKLTSFDTYIALVCLPTSFITFPRLRRVKAICGSSFPL